MTDKLEIETRLDQALRKQLPLSRLDGRFNAAVWAQIAAAEAPVSASASPVRSARWLRVSNALGMVVSAVLVLYFLVSSLSGFELALSLPLPSLPELPASAEAMSMSMMFWSFTIAAMVFAFAFTGMGRRVRQLLRSEFA
jgi:hypothetical protein